VPSRTRQAPKIKNKPIVDNIVFIIGESLSASYAGSLGYEKPTTPFLSLEKTNPNSIVKKAFSAGLVTDVSVPFLINMIQAPNAAKQIFSLKTNLFRLSKKQDYKTFLFSAQSEAASNFLPILGVEYMDQVQTAFKYTKDVEKEIDDKYLVDFFDEQSFAKRNFIVLQQNGSHEPYNEKYPKSFNNFGNDTLKKHYLNSITYTDFIIKEIVEKAKSSFKNYVVIYSSDHGQHVTDTSGGKGNFEYASNYEVPLYITTNSKEVLALAKEIFESCKYSLHVQISEFIALLMGYEVAKSRCEEGFVSGLRLTGNSGYLHITQDKNKTQRNVMYK